MNLLNLVLILLCFFSLSHGEVQIRVMTFNMYKAGLDLQTWPTRREEIRGLVLQEKPDILALQGLVNRTDPAIDQFSDLLRSLPGDFFLDGTRVFYPNTEVGGGMRGLAIFTKKKYFGGHSLFKSLKFQNKQSAILHIPLLIEGQHINFFTTELASTTPTGDPTNDPDTVLKRSQLEKVMEWVKKITNNFDNQPIVLVGDFKLRKRNANLLEETGLNSKFSDAWSALHPNSGGDKGDTFIDADKKKSFRYDRVFLRHAVAKSIVVKSVPAEVADHQAIVADILVSSRPAESQVQPTQPQTHTPTQVHTQSQGHPQVHPQPEPQAQGHPQAHLQAQTPPVNTPQHPTQPTRPPVTRPALETQAEKSEAERTQAEKTQAETGNDQTSSTYLSAGKSLIIVGGVLGAVLAVGIVAVIYVWWRKRSNNSKKKKEFFRPLEIDSFTISQLRV